jgi:hypothetical protein
LWHFDERSELHQGEKALISASFATLNDSVFWDSKSNLAGLYIIEIDSTSSENPLHDHVSKSWVGDSVTLLVKTPVFFSSFFSAPSIPYFSQNDSVVKINFKVLKKITEKEEQDLVADGEMRERIEIRNFYSAREEFEKAGDPDGFFWVEKPDTFGTGVKTGEMISLSFRASFLNGRALFPTEQVLSFYVGTPDQVLPGLNYVISRLKKGQNAKIILPSRLAFGEFGSSNGTIPPFTPLLFEIKLLPA